ncbi:kinase-like protein, partial [Marasmius fiardii PR-910]
MMVKLSKSSGLYPECLTIKNVKRVGEQPIGWGAYGDVWKGKAEEQLVCLKAIRTFSSDEQNLRKEISQEAIVWKQANFHPNVLPFLGMYYWKEARNQICLISPYLEHGNLSGLLKKGGENIDRRTLAYDVASGVDHFHDLNIVHGDLKADNVLIRAEDLRACIGDFGIARISDKDAISLSTSSGVKGTLRYLAPESLGLPPEDARREKESDVYAYGCVCYEIFTGRQPFYEISEAEVILYVNGGKRPTRPRGMKDQVWNLMVDCWKEYPTSRPTASQL